MKEPLFCPRKECEFHQNERKNRNWYIKAGFYFTNTFKKIQRFKCRVCGHKFSSQTFNIDYYAKKKINYRHLVNQLKSTGSIRDIARDLRISTGTVQNKIFRLSRQAIALHSRISNSIDLKEDLVADGFESFSVSQFFPNNIHLLAGKDSQYVYFANHVTIRRKGRMTKNQKIKRKELEKTYRADKKGISKSFKGLINRLLSIKKQSKVEEITLFTDEKIQYRKCIKSHTDIKHVCINSRKMRNLQNRLFAVNYLDRQIRKDMAEHVRETVCFSRNVNNSMERLSIYLYQHNYQKNFRENRIAGDDKETHAKMAGIDIKDFNKYFKTFFTKRAFFSLNKIEGFEKELWFRELDTPLKKKEEYIPQYASA